MQRKEDRVVIELAAVAHAVAANIPGLSREIWEVLTGDIPELRGDEVVQQLLDASVEENVATLLHIYEHAMTLEEVHAPAAAVEYARRLAQRDVPIGALTRAYRVGHGRFLARCLDELGGRTIDRDLAAAVTSRMLEISFDYIDLVSEEVSASYQRERDRWLLTRTAMRAGRVRDLLRGDRVDLENTEKVLGYRLRQHHLGVIAWSIGDNQANQGLTRLDQLGATASRRLGGHGRHLSIPRDEALAWIWIPIGNAGSLTQHALTSAFADAVSAIRIAVGEPAHGLDGFRQTHVQAERTQDLALVADPGMQVTTFTDVGSIALICADVAAARSWVWGTLADLALDDEPHARLRTTLQVFLHTGTYTATAERLAMHKNSVQYRIHRAEQALGGSIQDRHADLELALRACEYLGRAVLRPSGSRA